MIKFNSFSLSSCILKLEGNKHWKVIRVRHIETFEIPYTQEHASVQNPFRILKIGATFGSMMVSHSKLRKVPHYSVLQSRRVKIKICRLKTEIAIFSRYFPVSSRKKRKNVAISVSSRHILVPKHGDWSYVKKPKWSKSYNNFIYQEN